MTAASQSPLPSSESPTTPGAATTPDAAKPQFSLRKVLWIVVPVALLGVVTVALFGLVDVGALFGDLTRPAIVPVHGKITFQGEPMRNAQIMTRPTAKRGLAAIGWTDGEGNITLNTDIRGVRTEGATVGEHVVAVTVYGSSGGASAPPLLSPLAYASMSTTPLRITVERDAAANHFELKLEGEPASQSRPETKGKQGGMRQPRPKGAKAQPAPEPATASESAASESASPESAPATIPEPSSASPPKSNDAPPRDSTSRNPA